MRLSIIAQLSESNKTTARLKMCNFSLTACIISYFLAAALGTP
jgi:hypothetical protein